jgi:aryl-alcohol dehydrogenase-like predicted oxidoreductase
MEYTRLGRTGLEVSVAGLGCGGPSRLGRSNGAGPEESERVVREALDLGITLLDTSELYGTEEIVGRAIAGRRDEIAVSTKGYWKRDDRILTPDELTASIDASLRRLGTNRVEVYHLHALEADHYEEVRATLVPVLERARDDGKIGHIACSEIFGVDTGHRMLARALDDDCWDVVMVGFNMLNPSARDRVFPKTLERDVGTLVMFAVRRALSIPDRLRETVAELRAQGHATGLDPDDPLGFLVREDCAWSVVEAAYRFCRHEPGVDVVLTGTGNVEHLRDNVRSILSPPLPPGDLDRLRAAFGTVDTVAAN